MEITYAKLGRAAAVCAIAAGLLFAFIQFIHPDETVANTTTTAWAVTHVLSMVMAVFAIVGITGLYLRQVRGSGLLGLTGAVLFSFGWLIVMAHDYFEAAVLPALAGPAPLFAKDALAVVTGKAVVGDAGGLPLAYTLAGLMFLGGGLVFGIASFRARVLYRWASLLLAVGALAAVLVAVLPHSLDRLAAFPIAAALVALGVSLWRSPVPTDDAPRVIVDEVRSEPARA